MKQPELDFNFTGEQLARAGLNEAVDHANLKVKDWSKSCWLLFLVWLRRRKRGEEFMIETFRKYLKDYDLLEDPPSLRAFGFLSKRGMKHGLISFSGMAKVKNKNAHAAFASKWIKV